MYYKLNLTAFKNYRKNILILWFTGNVFFYVYVLHKLIYSVQNCMVSEQVKGDFQFKYNIHK